MEALRKIQLTWDEPKTDVVGGKTGENGATAIVMDCNPVRAKWPDATYTLQVRLPSRVTYQPIVGAETDSSGQLLYVLSARDTAKGGSLVLEYTAIRPNGQVVKSCAYTVSIPAAMGSVIGTPNSPNPEWVVTLTQQIQLVADNTVLVQKLAEQVAKDAASVEGIPPVTEADEGKFLGIVGGEKVWKRPSGGSGEGGADGVTFTPTVSDEGIISWTNDGGLPNPEPKNIKGQPGKDGADGKDYVLTDADKQEIAEQAVGMVEPPEIPDKLPNPHALTFTGAASGTYDGSAPLTLNIPSGGEGGGGGNLYLYTHNVTIEENVQEYILELPCSANQLDRFCVVILIPSYEGNTVEKFNLYVGIGGNFNLANMPKSGSVVLMFTRKGDIFVATGGSRTDLNYEHIPPFAATIGTTNAHVDGQKRINFTCATSGMVFPAGTVIMFRGVYGV